MTNSKNIYLLIFTLIVVLAAGFLALLVGLVLPAEFREEYHESEKYSSWNSPIIAQSQSFAHTNPCIITRMAQSRSLAHINPYIRERNEERHYGNISDFSWLVSLSIPLYQDDPFAKYVCTGVVISEDEVLTGNDCIRDPYTEEDFFKSTVRSESEFFYVGGIMHDVVDFLAAKQLPPPYDALYILRVAPAFSNNVKTLPLHSMKVQWDEAIAAGWGGNKIPYIDIIKHEPFHYERWFKDEEECCNNLKKCHTDIEASAEFCVLEAVLESNISTPKINGRPLVLVEGEYRFLVGVQMNEDIGTDLVTFLDLRHDQFLDWARMDWAGRLHFQTSGSYKQKLNLFQNVTFSSYNREKIHDAELYESDNRWR